MKSPAIKVHITDTQESLKFTKSSLKKLVQEIIRFENQSCHEVTLHLISDKQMRQLHADYFDDPSPTDCISFPLDGPEEIHYRILGEVFVCPDTAIEFVKKSGGNAEIETALYIIHGLLHLMGYDDIKPTDRALMRAAEKKHLDNLSVLDLYLKLTTKR